MITGPKTRFAALCRQRGYTLEEVQECVMSQSGDEVTVDESHAAYPRKAKRDFIRHHRGMVVASAATADEVRSLIEAAAGRHEDTPTTGPGTQLKKLLARVGIVATPNCSCNARAAEMDRREQEAPGWCEANLETIVGWLREEAAKRRMPFIDGVGKMLVRRAITNARKERAGDEAKEGQQGGSAV